MLSLLWRFKINTECSPFFFKYLLINCTRIHHIYLNTWNILCHTHRRLPPISLSAMFIVPCVQYSHKFLFLLQYDITQERSGSIQQEFDNKQKQHYTWVSCFSFLHWVPYMGILTGHPDWASWLGIMTGHHAWETYMMHLVNRQIRNNMSLKCWQNRFSKHATWCVRKLVERLDYEPAVPTVQPPPPEKNDRGWVCFSADGCLVYPKTFPRR